MPPAPKGGAETKVALVYPPFGPAGVPSLGLALLAATLKARGYECCTFYWNLELIEHLPGPDVASRLKVYHALTNRFAMPFNEWTFAELVHGGALQHRDAQVRDDLASTMRQAYGDSRMREYVTSAILSLRMSAAEHVERFAGKLKRFDVIGVNSTFYQNLPALALAKCLKAKWPAKRVVMGGANCDGDMGPALAEHFPFLDAIFVGEADHSFISYVERTALGQSYHEIRGIVFRDDRRELCATPPGAPVNDLDALPVPDFDDFVRTREITGIDVLQELTIPLESSRGCWWGAKHHCTFCGLNANGIAYRKKSAERFEREIREISERYGAHYVFMTDNILSMEYFNGFVQRAAERGGTPRLFYEIKANLTRRHVDQLVKAGITGVQPGIESLSSSVLSLMNKGTTGIQNVALLRYARELGLFLTYNILIGFPGEDASEYERLGRIVRALSHLRPPTSVTPVEFHRFSPYHDDPERYGLELRSSAKYEDLYPFPTNEIDRIAYLFERRSNGTVLPYIRDFAERINEWRSSYSDSDCTLTWQNDGTDVLIEDRRPGFRNGKIRLSQYAADLFRSLEQPKSVNQLIAEARAAGERDDITAILAFIFADASVAVDLSIAFTAHEFLERPQFRLEELVAHGLLFAEHDRYLALPISSSYRLPDLGWLRTGV